MLWAPRYEELQSTCSHSKPARRSWFWGRVRPPFLLLRAPQAALKCFCRSDSVTRECPSALRVLAARPRRGITAGRALDVGPRRRNLPPEARRVRAHVLGPVVETQHTAPRAAVHRRTRALDETTAGAPAAKPLRLQRCGGEGVVDALAERGVIRGESHRMVHGPAAVQKERQNRQTTPHPPHRTPRCNSL